MKKFTRRPSPTFFQRNELAIVKIFIIIIAIASFLGLTIFVATPSNPETIIMNGV